MSFVLYNLHMKNISNDIASTIKQLVDDVVIFHYSQYWIISWWIKLKFEKQIWMKIMSFNSDLNKHGLEVTFSGIMTKSGISGIYLNEKLNFYHRLSLYVRWGNLVY